MSVLGDAVTARDTAGRLVNLTNAATSAGRAATNVDTTVLAAAVADATADFATKAGETLDATNAQHLAIAVPGVWAYLTLWKGQEGAQAQMDRFQKSCEDYRMTRANKRITPITDRGVGPSPDVDGDGQGRRPEFDAPRFSRSQINPPGSTTSADV